MKKVLRLVSVQIWALLGDMLSIGNIRKKRPKALSAGILAFLVMMGAIVFFYCYMVGQGLLMFDSIQLLPPMIMAVTSIVVLMTTILKVKGTIFGFRDFDMIMSLPVSTSGIVASRVLLLYAINLLFVFMFMVPMMVAYGILAGPKLFFYVNSGILIFFIPMIPIILASVLGTLVTYLATRFRHSNLVTIIISLLAFLSMMGLSMITKDTGEELVNMSKQLTKQINSMYALASLYTDAVIEGNIIALGFFVIISLAAFVIYSYIIGKLFKKINTLIMSRRARSNYKLGELKALSPLKALYWKELKRYFASPIYVLNTGLGVVILTLGALAAIFVDPQKLLGTGTSELPVQIMDMVPIMVSFCIVMSSTTMASISLEGKSLWILKSLPITAKTIFGSKLLVNLTILAPVLFDVLLLVVILEMGFLKGLIVVAVAVLCSLFTALFGLLINLRLPNFNWTSETMVVKQSAASMVVIFTGMAVVGAQFPLILLLPSFEVAYLIYIGALALLILVLYQVLITYGVKRFKSLN